MARYAIILTCTGNGGIINPHNTCIKLIHMKINNHDLLDELLAITEEVITQAKTFEQQQAETLNHRPQPASWNALECLEHLNLYGAFYLKEIEQQLAFKRLGNSTVFKPGLLGNYFVSLVNTNRGVVKKMKSPHNMMPVQTGADNQVVSTFIAQQQQLRKLLLACYTVDLQKNRTAISLTRFIRLRLGDTLRFVVYHNRRHTLQAQRAIRDLKS